MTPTQSNVLIERIPNPPNQFLIKSEEPDKAKVLKIGPSITELKPNQTILLDWNHATNVQSNQYIININHIIAAIDI